MTEQNVIIAEWCEPRENIDTSGAEYEVMQSPEGFWLIYVRDDTSMSWKAVHLSTDLNEMASALAVVKERGSGIAYAWALAEVLGIWQSPLDWYPAFLLIESTAAQRAEALVRMIEGEK